MFGRDITTLFATRITRLFAYGFLSVVLVLYLAALGFSDARIGLLLTLTLLGDTVVSLCVTTSADRLGRKWMLIVGAALMILAGVVFVLTRDFTVLLAAAVLGVISPSGSEVGPFLSIEQAALAQLVDTVEKRTTLLAWYNLAGSFATATGALAGGFLAQFLQGRGVSPVDSYRDILLIYAALGGVLAFMFTRLTPAAEAQAVKSRATTSSGTGSRIFEYLGLPKSGPVVVKLSGLFTIDAFAGGLVLQSVVAYWFHVRYGVQPAVLGSIFFAGNILAGVSALAATWLAKHIGLIRTMVFTHIPSNILLILVPLMPNLELSITMLLLRFSISQMDVPTRQSYTLSVVEADERSAAGGVTGVARSAGASVAPALAGRLMGASMFAAPFLIAGGLKIVYDLLLYRSFANRQSK